MDRAEEAMDDFADKTSKASISAEESVRRVEAAIDDAKDETQELNRTLEQVDGKEVDVDVDIDGKREADSLLSVIGKATSRMSRFSRAMKVLRKRMPGVIAGVGALGGTLVAVTGGMVGATAATAGLTAALTGVVGGMGAVGVAAAAMSEDVKRAFSGLKSAVQEGLLLLTRPIQSVLADLASRLKGVFAQVAPELKAIFSDVAEYVEIFADALLPVANRVMPSFVAIVDRARPVVQSFADGLASLGPALTKSLGDIERAIPAIQSMVEGLFAGLQELIPFMTDLFADIAKDAKGAVEAFGRIVKETTKEVGEFIKSLSLLSSALLTPINNLEDAKQTLSDFGKVFRGVVPGESKGAQGSFLSENTEEAQKMLRNMLGVEKQTSEASQAIEEFFEKLRNNSLGSFNEELSKTEKAMKSLSDQLEGVELGGKLAKVRGEFDRVAQREAELRAVGEAYKELAAAKGEDAQETQKLFKRYRKLAKQLRILKGEAEDVEGGVMPEVPAYDPEGIDLPESTLNLDVELNFDQMKLAIDALKGKLKTALGSAITSASRQFGQEFSEALWSAFSGPDEGRIASLEERRLDLKQELENLNRKEMAHERYTARVKAIHAELAETNKQLARETAGVFERVFRGLGNLVENVIKQVIADIAAAIAKAAALKAISMAITGGSGPAFGAFLQGGVSTLFGGAGAVGGGGGFGGAVTTNSISPSRPSTPMPTQAAPTGALTVNVQGEFRHRGEDLVATINATQNANTRRGRS